MDFVVGVLWSIVICHKRNKETSSDQLNDSRCVIPTGGCKALTLAVSKKTRVVTKGSFQTLIMSK